MHAVADPLFAASATRVWDGTSCSEGVQSSYVTYVGLPRVAREQRTRTFLTAGWSQPAGHLMTSPDGAFFAQYTATQVEVHAGQT